MARFLIPPEMAPGVYRAGVGFFVPGQEIELPDAASKDDDAVSLRFVPLDEEAFAILKATAKAVLDAQKDFAKANPSFPKLAPPVVKPIPVEAEKAAIKAKIKGAGKNDGDQQTLKQAGGAEGTGREADK